MELESAQQQQHQTAVDLHAYLLDRTLHPELFQQYATHRVSQGKYHVDIWIIGLGHVVTLTDGARTITEVVSREIDALPSRGVLTHFRLKGERDHDREVDGGYNYMLSSQVETMDDALYKSVHHDLLRHAGRRRFLVTYDEWSDGEMTPFTHIDIEARDREFHFHAFHTFPGERTVVKTQSLFELPPL